MSELRIGVCGRGPAGERHARLLAGLPGTVVTLFDAAAPIARRPAPGSGSFHELLESGPHGMIVATGPAHRAGQAIAACERGIPVLVDAPVADTVPAAAALHAAAVRAGVPVLAGYPARHSGTVRLVRRILTSGELGSVRDCHLRCTGPTGADSWSGLPHRHTACWDYLAWLFGPVREVAALAGDVVPAAGGTAPPGQTGTAELPVAPARLNALLAFDGFSTTVQLDDARTVGAHPTHRHELTVTATAGSLHADLVGAALTVRGRHGSRCYQRVEQPDEAYLRQLRHFLAVVRRGEAPTVTAADGVAALRVADALVAAAAEHAWQAVRDGA